MPIRQFTIDPPFAHESGDVYARVGDVVKQIRGGIEIDSRIVGGGALLTEQLHLGGTSISSFFEEQKMPGVVATLTNVVAPSGPSGVHRYQFSDGTELEYATRAAAMAQVEHWDTNPQTARELLVLQDLRRDQGGVSVGAMKGRCCTVDCSAQSPVSMSLGLELS